MRAIVLSILILVQQGQALALTATASPDGNRSFALLASEHRQKVIFLTSNETTLSFSECTVDDSEFDQPLLSIRPDGRDCSILGGPISADPATTRAFDEAMARNLSGRSLSAGFGTHTLFYAAGGTILAGTAAFWGLAVVQADSPMASIRASWPAATLGAILMIAGYVKHQSALEDARLDAISIETSVRKAMFEIRNGTAVGPSAFQRLNDTDISDELYEIFRQSILAAIEHATIA